ncbi:uncharacterized protein LOC121987812 [Zingiber officinale]|uniref:Late embryogenesis abundant protein LEA-2 subgroup domain-containing protein n=1 Tax=Zingiber officinale TaxID=94328 RepID=A0A8J5LCW9_ZINOF|nr:uncharacterized protein LOC121981904 [Zingiber officinale]XP_042397469.1 uncharacterized protein LOC121987812 [Zingiber officinale]KAG6505027.1 hypothetical protein ZIOFF_037375 [Zingiber officinale]KAG6508492.1 hypothetical protein ZIOFF_033866 [Zingiber officinale]
MATTHPPHHRGGGGTNLASCLLATVFLFLVFVAAAVVLFVLFRPRDPEIQVSAVQLPGFSAANGTLRFTFNQYAAVRNPNRAAFSHYDSTLQLAYAGHQVGFAFIPAGKIAGGRTQRVATSFSVNALRPPGAAAAIEVDSRLRVKGRVRVLSFFTHHVEATARCRVAVSAADGSVLGVRC